MVKTNNGWCGTHCLVSLAYLERALRKSEGYEGSDGQDMHRECTHVHHNLRRRKDEVSPVANAPPATRVALELDVRYGVIGDIRNQASVGGQGERSAGVRRNSCSLAVSRDKDAPDRAVVLDDSYRRGASEGCSAEEQAGDLEGFHRELL